MIFHSRKLFHFNLTVYIFVHSFCISLAKLFVQFVKEISSFVLSINSKQKLG